MKRDPSMARLIGGGLAHIQHAVDSALLWGFRKIKDIGEATPAKTKRDEAPSNRALAKAKSAGKGLLAFLGDLGDSYFEKYGELKNPKK